MNDHYYSEHPQAESHPQVISVELRSIPCHFTTDAGVFSRKGVDFGSRLLIESFREPPVPGRILDMGCGYGPIGIALAKAFPERRIMMADINERAVRLAHENVNANHVTADVVQSHLFTHVDGTFAAIVTNPPIRAGKKIVREIFQDAFHHLVSGGEFWSVIQKKQGAPSALTALRELFGTVQIEARKKGYHVFCAKKIDNKNRL
ncbi:class I SAM-dependent methyltransferase [Sporolactobacillus sp. Y61]|uniref:Class I SAM-dependent methyltransferase n=1 Tax=Sporolactobacillus sp. Y61 TaxID=3160863 RepID=A0AAU8IGI6_9BACL